MRVHQPTAIGMECVASVGTYTCTDIPLQISLRANVVQYIKSYLVRLYLSRAHPHNSTPLFVMRGLSPCRRWLAFGGAMTSNVAAASRGVLAKVSTWYRLLVPVTFYCTRERLLCVLVHVACTVIDLVNAGRSCIFFPANHWSDWLRLLVRTPGLFFTTPLTRCGAARLPLSTSSPPKGWGQGFRSRVRVSLGRRARLKLTTGTLQECLQDSPTFWV